MNREVAQETDPLFDEAFMGRLSWLEIVSKRIQRGRDRGERRLGRLGAGLEFADHRRYSPGDDFRHIDWNVYRRLGKLLLRLYEEDEDLGVHLLVDTSASMGLGTGQVFRQARRLAAALAYVALGNLDRVSVVAVGEGQGPRLREARGRSQIFGVLDFLRGLEASGATSLEASVRSFVKARPRRGVAILLSDLYTQDGLEAGLRLLQYHRFEPLVLHLVDPPRVPAGLRGEVTLVDCETGAEREITLSPDVVRAYRASGARWREQLTTLCRSAQIPYLEVDPMRPMEEVVVDMLRQGALSR